MMNIFETLGMAWVLLSTVCMTVGVIWLAFRGFRSLLTDSRIGLGQRRAFERMHGLDVPISIGERESVR